MTVKRLRHLVATIALILFVPGGGSTALAETDTATDRATAAAEPDSTARAVQHQRRVEAAWLGEQVRAGARSRVPQADGPGDRRPATARRRRSSAHHSSTRSSGSRRVAPVVSSKRRSR
jgi:hypothetical protein